ncbi:MAG: GTP 3',8-cyclase MoaA [Synergistaceae bacterium]|jgi:cyclic pyranopterin phosphate synthase|nr:GTP 3',8-cyclase MoaA [Synergistaceae bacterium]
MRDRFGREIGYARISITDRCNLRCVYCMPESGVKSLRHADILSYENILRICRVFAALGIRKLRVTGGEPLVRKGAVGLIASLKKLEGVSVTLTTNGLLLPEKARELRDAGLDGVNISLDTRDPSAYFRLTRGGDVRRVLAGIDAAVETGIPQVKVNCVPLGEDSREDVLQVAALARDRAVHVRFIEMMPIGPGTAFVGVDNRRLRQWLEREYGDWTPLEESLKKESLNIGYGPARYGSLTGFQGKIGFISPISDCFCEKCNRIRLTSTGLLRTCLNRSDGVSLLPALSDLNDSRLFADIRGAILEKPERHDFVTQKEAARGTMFKIGG